ncbi:MAG TPA: site-specific integrase [Conexivisphaerales archaeon]|nr:site-specific integrase [Conexivisphaerales archaeon]
MTSVSYSYTEWIASYPNMRTQNAYVTGVKAYLRHLYGDSTAPVKEQADRYLREITAGGRDHYKDLISFLGAFHDKPPKSVATYMAAVKNFLLLCADIELGRKELRMLKDRLPRGSMARTVEKEMGKEELRKILLHCDVRGRALFTLLLSSGIRVSEALQLTMEDVDLQHDPPMVTVRGEYTKEGDRYVSFISSEAKEALLQYLGVRETYLASTIKRTANIRKRKWRPWSKKAISRAERANRIFPFSTSVAGYKFTLAVHKAGLLSLDSSTGRKQIHIHMLRKFFMSQMKLSVPDNVVEALTGHSAYLSDAYRRYTTQQLGKLYLKGEPDVLVNSTVDMVDMGDQLRQKDLKIEGLKGQVLDLTVMNQKLMVSGGATEAKLADLESRVQRWEAYTRKTEGQSYEEMSASSPPALRGQS